MIEEQARAALVQAGAPSKLWGYALLHQIYNYDRSPLSNREDGKSPHNLHFQTDMAFPNLVPFGTGAVFLDEATTPGNKFVREAAMESSPDTARTGAISS